MKTNFRMFRSAGLVGLGTLSSRILGLVREILMASTFGTEGVVSAFFVAFTVPNLFRRLFGEGALSAAFVPHFVHLRDDESPEAAARTTRAVGRWLVRWLGTISLLGIGIASLLLNQEAFEGPGAVTLLCLRILMPYVVGICLAALMMGVLNAQRNFTLPAFTPCILNLMWIAALLHVSAQQEMVLEEKVLFISWTILAAGFVQFGAQAVAARKYLPKEASAVKHDPGLSVILQRMAPAAMGAAVTQVNVLVDRLLAFWVGDYGPAALTYSERLIYLPLGLFATALGTVLLPEFSSHVQKKDQASIDLVLNRSLRVLSFIMLPAAVGLAVLASPIITLVFERGAFDATSTLLTSRALLLYAPGLFVFSMAKVVVPVFHAHGDTRTPMRIGMFAVVVNLGLNLLFIAVFPEGWKHAGMAAGTVLSVLLQVTWLSRLIQKRHATIHGKEVFLSWARHGLAAVPMAFTALLVEARLAPLPLLLNVPLTITASALVYFVFTWVLRCPEWKDMKD